MLKISNQKHKKYYIAVIFSIFSLIFIVNYFIIGFDSLNYDLFFRYRNSYLNNKQKINDNIVVVEIDDKSLLEMDKVIGDWPWKRAIHAQLIDRLKSYGAKSIFLDFLYSERSLTNKEQFVRLLNSKYNISKRVADNLASQIFVNYSSIVEQLERNRVAFEKNGINVDDVMRALNIVYNDNDIVLMNSIYDAKNVFLSFLSSKEKKDVVVNKDIINKLNYSSIDAVENVKIKSWVRGIRIPLYGFIKGAKSVNNVSFINFTKDMNRTIPIILYMNNRYYSHMDLALFNDYYNRKLNEFKIYRKMGKQYIEFFNRKKTQIDTLGRVLVNFRGRTPMFNHFSYVDIVYPQNDSLENYYKTFFKNKIVLVGATAEILQDLWKTPIGLMPGITYHANFLNTLLNSDFIRVLSKRDVAIFSLLLSISLIIFFWFSEGLLLNTIISLIMFILFPLFSFYLFNYNNFYISLLPYLLSIGFTYFSFNVFRTVLERYEKSQIRHSFERYVSSNIVNEILKSPESIELGGEKRDMSILFSDIRSFTTFSEEHDPSEIITRLNEFFNVMTKVIYDNNGTLDKYVGDEIMALFGAPIHYQEHAYMACLTAVMMINELKKMREIWIKDGKKPFDIGVGINSAEVVVGNIGSNYVMDYTVIGDGVNLAARVEAETRNYDAHIIITEFTLNRIENLVGVTYLNDVVVKGKTEPVKLYRLDWIIDKENNKIIVEKID